MNFVNGHRRSAGLRIAQVAPLAESVPPKAYGGTERIVSYLTEQLVAIGHDVTLFASRDSITSARLVACVDEALRLKPTVRDHLPYQLLLVDQVDRLSSTFDIIHFHTDLLHFPLLKGWGTPAITTLHGRLDLPDLDLFYRAFDRVPLVSISDDQRRPMPPVNWLGTVYHGLPPNLLPFQGNPSGGYLAFLGRISPEKRPDRAIEIARIAGLPLKIAAKIDLADQDYWVEVIEPMVNASSNVEFIGEITEQQKASFLGSALASLFPIDWPEPFGLVMIEAMSCGTPTIAFNCGSVPEVLEHGRSGLIVATIDEAVQAIPIAIAMSRAEVRAAFDERFTAHNMARNYVTLYEQLIDQRMSAKLAALTGQADSQVTA